MIMIVMIIITMRANLGRRLRLLRLDAGADGVEVLAIGSGVRQNLRLLNLLPLKELLLLLLLLGLLRLRLDHGHRSRGEARAQSRPRPHAPLSRNTSPEHFAAAPDGSRPAGPSARHGSAGAGPAERNMI